MNKGLDDLYIKLKDAYTEENLNIITSKIIDLYKNKQFDSIKDIIEVLSEFTEIRDEKHNKNFSRLIMLYHPDKINHYIKEIDKFYKKGDMESLFKFSHIFSMLDIENTILTKTLIDLDIDFSSQYEWDYGEKGFNYFTEDDMEDYGQELQYSEDDIFDNSFYSAVKRKIYGSLNIDLPSYLLEDMEEIDMAEYEIENLEGIECCKYVKYLDLSNNYITDISEINTLTSLEELYLTNNNIGFIDAVFNLKKLRILDISNNEIDDLSPLFNLQYLEYVNILGNTIPETQIHFLKNKGIMIVC